MIKRLNRVVFLLLLLFVSSNAVSQENIKGIHQLQAEEFRANNISVSKKHSTAEIAPINTEALEEKKLDRVVFGFLPDWEVSSADMNMRYELLSHLAVFAFSVQQDGSFTYPSGWPGSWATVMGNAHNAGTKVVMTITNFQLGVDHKNDTYNETHPILIDGPQRDKLFSEIKKVITANNLDGINVDFEGAHVASYDRGAIMNNFLIALKAELNSISTDQELSFSGPAVNWGGWEFGGMSDIVDHLFIMAYDYNFSKTKIADEVSPLYSSSVGWDQSIDRTVRVWYKDAIANHPEKVILGIAYYGQSWKTNTSNLNSTVIKYNWSTRYRDIEIFNSEYTREWDDVTRTPRFYDLKYDEETNADVWWQVYMDDVESIALKYDYALDKGLGGVGMWALNFDGDRPELWDLIRDKFEGLPSLSTDDFADVKISVYPNPVQNILNVDVSGVEGKVIIYSILGEVIYEGTSGKISTGSWDKGLYFVSVDVGNRRQVFKLMK